MFLLALNVEGEQIYLFKYKFKATLVKKYVHINVGYIIFYSYIKSLKLIINISLKSYYE